MKSALLLRFALASLGVGAVAVGVVGCSREEKSATEAARSRKVKIVFSRASAEGAWFGLTEETPSFIGVSASAANGGGAAGSAGASFQKAVAVGDAPDVTLEVPLGKVGFRSSLVSAKVDDGYLYYTQAAQDVDVSDSTAEVVLKFLPYKPVKPINVYGLIHADRATPAAGAQVRILDPFTSAPVSAPGTSSFAVTDAKGTFAGSFPFDAFPGLKSVQLEVSYKGKTTVQTLVFTRGNAPGVALPFVNLQSGGNDVVPQFSKQTDYDGDGTPSDFELAAGTNPFSELSGARGKDGLATLVRTGVATAQQCANGGVTVEYLLDVDGSLTLTAADTQVGATSVLCNGQAGTPGANGTPGTTGATGAMGLQGSQGPQGLQGPAGTNAAPPLKVRDPMGTHLTFLEVLIGADPQSSYSLLRFADGKKIWARPQITSDSGVNSRLCVANAGSGGQQILGCQDNSLDPFYHGGCVYATADCSGSCFVYNKPLPDFIFAFRSGFVSGGVTSGYTVFSSPASQGTTTVVAGASGFSFSYGGSSGCYQNGASMGTTYNNVYELQPYTMPATFPVPIKPFILEP